MGSDGIVSNLDRIGWTRIGLDGMRWDCIGWDG